ncbi:unnamed protein product [Didymodactylos carnosus]|uniref:Chromo shadow domain-containing protein n=1 Tax=Didymodactylos carnosus TaxID=1234261 RepID=A0A8S2YYE6_9BILA|nr:unnamed protein product [Didymodactylos carnosus]
MTTTIGIHNTSFIAEDDVVIAPISSNTDYYNENKRHLSKQKALPKLKVKKYNLFNGENRLEKIISLRKVDDKSNNLEFQCKLRGLKQPTWVSNKILNELYPTDVIHFYQKLLKFDNKNKSENKQK